MRILSSAIFSLATLLAFVPIAASQQTKWPACTKPAVRKEWRALTKAEKANWIAAVNCLNKMPATPDFKPKNPRGSGPVPAYNKSGSYYDDWVYMHMDLANEVHNGPFFFSWHRWYVQVYENALTKYCNLTTPSPYWDWTKETNVKTSPMFTDPDPASGLGGWGDPKDDYQLTDGGFKSFKLSYPVAHRLRRNYTQVFSQGFGGSFDLPSTFTKAIVTKMINGFVGNFSGLLQDMEKTNGAHSGGHFVVGGDLAGACPKGSPANCGLGPFWSANEPLFWMHHGMVDKVWYDWQRANTANFLSFGGRGGGLGFPGGGGGGTPMNYTLDSIMPADGLGPEVAVRDVINTTAGFLCYVYE